MYSAGARLYSTNDSISMAREDFNINIASFAKNGKNISLCMLCTAAAMRGLPRYNIDL
jgi:hypothetical protein